MTEELKPCPFCGCCAVLIELNIEEVPTRHKIKCEDCPGGCDFYSSTPEQAIAAWNRRAPDAQPEPAGPEGFGGAAEMTAGGWNSGQGTSPSAAPAPDTFMGEPVLTRWMPLNRDDSRLALWQSMHKRDFGNPGDDKLMLEWLWAHGYALCKRAPDAQPEPAAPQPAGPEDMAVYAAIAANYKAAPTVVEPEPVATLFRQGGGNFSVHHTAEQEQRARALPSGNHLLYLATPPRAPSVVEPNPWREAVIDRLVVLWNLTDDNENDPRQALNDIDQMVTMMALDPAISSEAQALIDRGKAEATLPRATLNLMPVIQWLENGCDPLEAAKELRVYQATSEGPRNE